MAKSRGGDEKGPSQMEMVRQALEELGADAKPQAIGEHVKGKYGKDLPAQIISNYKSVLKRKAGGTAAARAGQRVGNRAGGIQFDDLETVRSLVNKLGAPQVRRLVDFLA